MRTRYAIGLATVGLLCASVPGQPWGSTGHRLITRKAVGTLAPPLRALFEPNAGDLAEHSLDPDLFRAAGRNEEADSHFLDMDAFGTVPRDEQAHLARPDADAKGKGRLPWRLAEAYADLVQAFREREPATILRRAALLSHYAEDAHMPLHAALNYDGRLTGQAGVHDRYESQLVERFARQIEPGIRPAAARRVADPLGLAFATLRDSVRQVPDLLASDRACAGPRDLAATPEDDRYGNAYFSCLYEKEGARLRVRLSTAAEVVGSLWWSAWEQAGRPVLPAYRVAYPRKGAKAVLVTLDGGSASLLEDAVARGIMPELARLRREGAVGRALPSLPSKTAPGHAALYTGAWADVNGVSGNDVSLPQGSILETRSGFSARALRAEPLWVTAARQGLDATLVATTQVFPFEPFGEERRFGGNFSRSLTLLDGYRNRESQAALYGVADLAPRPVEGWSGELPPHQGEMREVSVSFDGTRVFGLLFDDPADATQGLDTLLLAPSRDVRGGVTLKPRPTLGADTSAFASLVVKTRGGDVGVHFRLFGLSPDGRDILLYRSRAEALACNKLAVARAALAEAGGFVTTGDWSLYARGALGPRLWEGGDGTAERRYLETVALAVRQATRASEFALDRTAWDLLIAYEPYPDDALHLWWGRLDPSLPGHDPALAARLRPFLDQVLGLCDAALGRIRAKAGSDAVLLVAGDHGVAAADRVVRPNLALAQAGLLTLDASGKPDLARTRAFFTPGLYLLLNRTGRPGGIVTPEQEDAVRGEVARALRSIVDPESGRPVITGILDPRDGHEPGLGGPAGGDLYLTAAPQYDVSPALTGEVVSTTEPRGVHGGDPAREEMLATVTIAGPGVAAGADLGLVRMIDLAPTLARLLGLEPPAQARGHVLEKVLARR